MVLEVVVFVLQEHILKKGLHYVNLVQEEHIPPKKQKVAKNALLELILYKEQLYALNAW